MTGLKIRQLRSMKCKLLFMSLAVFALAVQPLYGFVASQVAAYGNPAAIFTAVVPDTTPPAFAIENPVNGQYVSGTVTLDAKITDDSDITKVLMGIGSISRSWANGSSSTITRTGDIFSTTIDTKTLADGPVYVSLRGTDGAGNTRYWNNNAGNRQHVFYVDNTAPTISLKTGTGADDGTKGTAPWYSQVSFKLYDKNANLKEVELNGHIYNRTGDWADLNWKNITKSHLMQGENTVIVRDRAGNASELKFFYDSIAPKITVKDDYVGDKDAKRFSNVSFKLQDSVMADKYVLNGHTVDFTNNKYSDANFENIKSRLVQGENTITLYDVAGNSTSYTFVYDTTAPAGTLSYSNNNGNALTSSDVVVTLKTTEPVRDIAGWTQVSDTEFTKTFADNGKFTVSITDIAGNTATVSGEVKRIDRTAPTISGVENSAVVAGPVELSIFDPKYQGYDGFDNNHGLTVNGVKVPTTNGPDKTYLYTITDAGEYTVVATDKAGNATTLTFTIQSQGDGDGDDNTGTGGDDDGNPPEIDPEEGGPKPANRPSSGGTTPPTTIPPLATEPILIASLTPTGRTGILSLLGTNTGATQASTASVNDRDSTTETNNNPRVTQRSNSPFSLSATDDDNGEVQAAEDVRASWSIVNTVLGAVAIVAGLMALLGLFAKREEGEESRNGVRVTAVVLAAAAAAGLFLLEDFSAPIGIVNWWTIAFAIVAATQVAIVTSLKTSQE